jgi:hypothetical protein
MTYLDEAKKRWPTARIIGDGRFACCAQNGALIYLAMTEDQQRSIALGVDRPVLVDLKPKFVPDLPDDWEDRRRERHEKRVQEQRLRAN